MTTKDHILGKRFADEELQEFYTEFKVHQKHEDDDRVRLLKCMTENREAVEALTESTKGLVMAWNDARTTVRVTKKLGKIFRWVAGLGIAYYAFIEAIKHIGK